MQYLVLNIPLPPSPLVRMVIFFLIFGWYSNISTDNPYFMFGIQLWWQNGTILCLVILKSWIVFIFGTQFLTNFNMICFWYFNQILFCIWYYIWKSICHTLALTHRVDQLPNPQGGIVRVWSRPIRKVFNPICAFQTLWQPKWCAYFVR